MNRTTTIKPQHQKYINPVYTEWNRLLREEVTADEIRERTIMLNEATKPELCPTCGAHLQNWLETFGEEHVCPEPTNKDGK